MARKELSLDTLKDLDFGKVDAAFRRELRRVMQDIQDRPTEQAKRKVAVVVEVWPSEVVAGEVEQVKTQFSITSKIPKLQSTDYQMALRSNGRLVFSVDAPENPNQGTFDEVSEDQQA